MPDRARPEAAAALERVATDAARAAAALIAHDFHRAAAVGPSSPPADPATETASKVGRLIAERLRAAPPRAGHRDAEGARTPGGASVQWVVGALDGAVNFRCGVPVVAVSVAAAVDGDVVAGAVVDVMHAEWFSAHLGGGARREGQPIAASSCGDLADAVVATGFSEPGDARAREADVAARVAARTRQLRCFGSPALELCWVACGRLDGYFARGVEVSCSAAAALIAEEAGAVTELPCPENDDLTIVAAARVFAGLRAVVELPATRPSS